SAKNGSGLGSRRHSHRNHCYTTQQWPGYPSSCHSYADGQICSRAHRHSRGICARSGQAVCSSARRLAECKMEKRREASALRHVFRLEILSMEEPLFSFVPFLLSCSPEPRRRGNSVCFRPSRQSRQSPESERRENSRSHFCPNRLPHFQSLCAA